MFALGGIGRIDGFHTAVETENEEVQVETKAQAVRHGNLLIEFIKLKHTAVCASERGFAYSGIRLGKEPGCLEG